jgi:IstB-like ATP binding protein
VLANDGVDGEADVALDKRLAELVRFAVLILDEFGIREHTPTQADDLYELVAARASVGKSLIITANRSPTAAWTSHRSTTSRSPDFRDAGHPTDSLDHDPGQMSQQDTRTCRITWRPSSCRPPVSWATRAT